MTFQELKNALEIRCNGYFFNHYLLNTQFYDLIDLAHALKAYYIQPDAGMFYHAKISLVEQLIDQLETIDEWLFSERVIHKIVDNLSIIG